MSAAGEKYHPRDLRLDILFYFVLWPTNAQLIHKLSHTYKIIKDARYMY